MLKSILGGTDVHFREVLHGAFWAFGLRVAGAILGFGFNVLLARALGAEGAGIYFLALTITTIASVVARLGLDNALLRDVAAAVAERRWADAAGLHRSGMLMAGAGTALAAAILFLGAPLIAGRIFAKPELAGTLRIMALAVPVFGLLAVQAEAVKARRQPAAATFLQGVGLPLCGVVALVALRGVVVRPDQVGLIYLGSTLVVLSIGLVMWWSRHTELWQCGTAPESWALLRSSLPLMNVAVLSLLTNWASMIALGLWASAAEIGQYGAAQRCAILTSFILVSVNSIVAPKFSALHAQGRLPELERLARQSSWLTFGLSAPVLLVYVLFAGPVLGIFGQGFKAAAPLLVVLAAGQFINAVTGSVGYLLMMAGLGRQMRNVSLVTAGATIVLNVILVPRFGGLGAAAATALTVAGMNLGFVYTVRRRLGIMTLPFLPGGMKHALD